MNFHLQPVYMNLFQTGFWRYTTEPGIHLDGSDIGKGGDRHKFRYGFCLKPQHFPDSPNQPHFLSTRLDSGKFFHSVSVYHLTTE